MNLSITQAGKPKERKKRTGHDDSDELEQPEDSDVGA